MIKKSFTAILALLSCAALPALATESGEAFFARYQSLYQSFDPAVADLYCDQALIRNERTYPDGTQRTLELPAAAYKDMMRSVMPMAKTRGDTSTYSDVKYAFEGSNVRIKATRYSELKKYASPLSMLVGRCADGRFGVLEELSQSRP